MENDPHFFELAHQSESFVVCDIDEKSSVPFLELTRSGFTSDGSALAAKETKKTQTTKIRFFMRAPSEIARRAFNE